ncbi:hypothetical protein PINS_up001214 [Pythium insidiosum]|nr:hypothetical protein PINS_up001214 [Pythium insidiosum]
MRAKRTALGAPVLAIFALAAVAFVMTVHNLSQSAGAFARANGVGAAAPRDVATQLRAPERRVQQDPLVHRPVVPPKEPEQVVVATPPPTQQQQQQNRDPTPSSVSDVVPVAPAPVEASLSEVPLQREPAIPPAAVALVPEETLMPQSFDQRHDVVHGFDDLNEYLEIYTPRDDDESLFLFFTCSDDDFRPLNWSDTCRDAMTHVYDVFSRSPSSNRLVTIYAGSHKFWQLKNAFYDDRDLRVKTVPCLMKWHNRNGETSGMMISETLFDDPLLRYLFKNTDTRDELLLDAGVRTKRITTVDSYDAYQTALTAYKAQPEPRHALYLLFVSGRLPENKRPWCPYCRFSEIPMEYGFYAFAPPGATLLRVEVTKTYQEWKTPNAFREDPTLGPLRGVPAFFIVRQLSTGDWDLERVHERFDRIDTVRLLYHRG